MWMYALLFIVYVTVASWGKVQAFNSQLSAVGTKQQRRGFSNARDWLVQYTGRDKSDTLSSTVLFADASASPMITAGETGAVEGAAKRSWSSIFAKVLGYCMGIGSLALYSPIIYTLVKTRDAGGFSIATWVLNLVGTAFALMYPFKMGYPSSTYAELMTITCQATGILALVCFLRGYFTQYLIGVVPFAVLYLGLLFSKAVPMQAIQALQVVSVMLTTYSNIPQIMLTFKLKRAAWSWITAVLSLTGCLVRVFTTLKLSGGDKLLLTGYILGAMTNFTLVAQVYIYNYLGLKL